MCIKATVCFISLQCVILTADSIVLNLSYVVVKMQDSTLCCATVVLHGKVQTNTVCARQIGADKKFGIEKVVKLLKISL